MGPLQTVAINSNLNKRVSEIVTASHLVIGPEKFDECFEEARPLLEKHWEEIAFYRDIPLDVDVDRYREIEAKGGLRIYTARIDGRLVGYACFFVAFHLHYKTTLFAMQDVVYVDLDARRSRIGLQLLRASESFLRAEGVIVEAHHQKVAHPALGVILSHSGYQQQDAIWTKRLDLINKSPAFTNHNQPNV